MERRPSRTPSARHAGGRAPLGLPDVPFAALRCFFAVAKAGSMSAAAPVLRMRQPGISKLVAALERELGTALLVRRARGVELTAAGQSVFASCERIFDELGTLERTARDVVDPRGEVFVAASDHIATYLLAPAIARLRKSAPAVVVRVLTGAAHLIVPGLVDGRPELGLFFKSPPSASVDRALLAVAPCQIVVAKAHAKSEAVLSSFIGSREVDDPANRAFPTLERLRLSRPHTAITCSSSGLEAHKELVRRGVGVSILPRFMVERELAAKELVVVDPAYTYFAELEVVTSRGRRLSKNAAVVLAELRGVLREMGLSKSHSSQE